LVELTLDELRASKRDMILNIAARHCFKEVRVFGSFARGTTNKSD